MALLVGNPWAAKTKKATTHLLQVSVVGLGFGMNLELVLSVGAQGALSTVVGIVLCMVVGTLLRMALGVPRDVGLLVTVGTAICGGSAIAAVVPAIGAKEDDATVSLAVVFLLNAAGLLIFPPLGHALSLDETQFGVWAALAVHDTSSVVGAASQYGAHALEVATTIKLTRALWIVPLSLLIGAWVRRTDKKFGAVRTGAKMPWFILGFIAGAAVATYVPGMHDVGIVVARVARQLLVVTLFLIGANLSRAALRAVGVRPLVLGVILWAIVAVGSLVALKAGILT